MLKFKKMNVSPSRSQDFASSLPSSSFSSNRSFEFGSKCCKAHGKFEYSIAIIAILGSIAPIVWFSTQAYSQNQENSMYTLYTSNITNYIVNEVNGEYAGYIVFNSTDNPKISCIMHNVTEGTRQKAEVNLEFYYPLYTLMDIYYQIPESTIKIKTVIEVLHCQLSLPFDPSHDTTAAGCFSVLFIIGICFLVNLIGTEQKWWECHESC